MTELQKYQWTMSGMRPDDSTMGAMWYYRGADVDARLRVVDEFLKWCSTWDGDPMTLHHEAKRVLG